MREDFAAFILTRGRPGNVKTLKTLKEQGYTGKVYLIIDNEDSTANEYIERYGEDKVIIFDKAEVAKRTDTADLAEDRRIVLFARNACFDIAESLGLRYFLQLDDDYTDFRFRYEEDGKLKSIRVKNLDKMFAYMIDFLNDSNALTVAFAQSGDFIGGAKNAFWRDRLKRKAMNTFFCDTKKPFQFMGSINEDVNMYTLLGNQGKLILSVADLHIDQTPTQQSKGGMSDIYLDYGTYLKSFYSVVFAPQCVKVAEMGTRHKRLHHRISWNNCTPMILSQKWKRKT